MMTPKYKKENVFMWEYRDLEDLIQHTYNIKKFSIPGDIGKGNDICQKYDIDKIEKDDDHYRSILQEDLEYFYNHHMDEDFYPAGMTRIFLEDMCEKNIIESGIHIINVCW